jgi:hypothetical protein
MCEEELTLTKNVYGDKIWLNKAGKLHRIGGPAVEYSNGTNHWYQNGQLHRIEGPAVEHHNGYNNWYLRGVGFESKEAFFEALTDEEKSIALFSEDFLNA